MSESSNILPSGKDQDTRTAAKMLEEEGGEEDETERIGDMLEEEHQERPEVEEVMEEFPYRSDEEMVSGSFSASLEQKLLDFAERVPGVELTYQLENREDGKYGVILPDWYRFGRTYARNVAGCMENHDERSIEDTYRMTGNWFAMSFTHIPLEERIEAGFGYADALFAKDRLEEIYREDGELKHQEMLENDGFEVSVGDIDFDDKRADFYPEDLGEWREVYDNFFEMSRRTVGEFFEDEERVGELAEYEALMRTMAWRRHKVGHLVDEDKLDYGRFIDEAQNLHIAAALQIKDYPLKHSKEGVSGPGYLGSQYSSLVELHDQYQSDDNGWMKIPGLVTLVMKGATLNRKRRNKEDLEMRY